MFLQAVKRTIDLIGHGDQEHIHKQNVTLLLIQLAIKERRGKGVESEKEREETGLQQTKVRFMFPRLCLSAIQRSTPVVGK